MVKGAEFNCTRWIPLTGPLCQVNGCTDAPIDRDNPPAPPVQQGDLKGDWGVGVQFGQEGMDNLLLGAVKSC